MEGGMARSSGKADGRGGQKIEYGEKQLKFRVIGGVVWNPNTLDAS